MIETPTKPQFQHSSMPSKNVGVNILSGAGMIFIMEKIHFLNFHGETWKKCQNHITRLSHRVLYFPSFYKNLFSAICVWSNSFFASKTFRLFWQLQKTEIMRFSCSTKQKNRIFCLICNTVKPRFKTYSFYGRNPVIKDKWPCITVIAICQRELLQWYVVS